MASLLLAVIYFAFVSLGLPDSLLGSAWPVMRVELGAPVSAMGLVTMIISAGTIVSSLASDFLTRKLGTGLVTAVSVLMTAGAMLGFSFARAFWVLCLIAVPYGLGAGAVDAALNNYVALHYKARHMSWLHCFWGVGALVSPFIMGACLAGPAGWEGGYRVTSYIQFGLTALIVLSLPLWVRPAAQDAQRKPLTVPQTMRLKGVPFLLGSLFYIGITVGRFVSGFVSERLGDRRLIRIGCAVIAAGLVLLALPLKTYAVSIAGFVVVGIGCAPVYPAIIHSTPFNFGTKNSQSVIGVEMAAAYVGTTFMPPLFGIFAQYVSIAWLPLWVGVFLVLLAVMAEGCNRAVDRFHAGKAPLPPAA